MKKRKYLPTFADLIDKLSICILKKIYISANTQKYQQEIDLIKMDIDAIMEEIDGMQLFNSDMIEATMVLMLTNRVIWENNSNVNKDEIKQDKLFKFTHSINRIRNIAKNMIGNSLGEKIDLKIDYLDTEIPTEFGNWNNLYNMTDEINMDELIDALENNKENILVDVDKDECDMCATDILKFNVDKNVKYKIKYD